MRSTDAKPIVRTSGREARSRLGTRSPPSAVCRLTDGEVSFASGQAYTRDAASGVDSFGSPVRQVTASATLRPEAMDLAAFHGLDGPQANSGVRDRCGRPAYRPRSSKHGVLSPRSSRCRTDRRLSARLRQPPAVDQGRSTCFFEIRLEGTPSQSVGRLVDRARTASYLRERGRATLSFPVSAERAIRPPRRARP